MRSRLLSAQFSHRVSGSPSIKVSRAPSRTGPSFARTAGIIVVLALTALATRAGILAGSFPPGVTAKSVIVLDLESGKELLSKNADVRVYPASLTKLMTALVLADNRSPGDLLRASRQATLQEPVTLGLHPGSTMTAAAAMDAMLVASANDVAYMVAEDVGGSAEDFARLMNSKARALGMDHTNFVTPNGLHDPLHYSTARDLALLFQAALQDPWISRSLAKRESTVTASAVTARLENTNPLLGLDGCTAGKTGSTSEAGKCLAALFERDGRRIVAVVMGSLSPESLVEDMQAVVDAAIRR